jgi:peptidoglycan hydrolase-like protein with peptidoglycan-binding domain
MMRKKLRTLEVRRPTIWVLAAAVLLAVPAGAVAKPGTAGHDAASSWPAGWSAGSVASGTGFSQLGASVRVREVQRKLNRLGYGAGKVDGLFGPATDRAVRRFQSGRALAADGIVGPRTLGQLRAGSKRLERLLDTGTGFSKPGGSARVRGLQRTLNRLGFGAGKVDGLFGPVTARAVGRFQAEHGLAVDAIAGPQTLRRLPTRTESVKEPGSRTPRQSREPRPQPADRLPPAPHPRSAPLRAPWEGQPLVATAATIFVLTLIAVLIGWAILVLLRRRPSRTAPAAPPPAGRPQPAPPPIERVGARVLLSPRQRSANGVDTVDVELRLFAESDGRHWEAEVSDPHLTAVAVAVDDLEDRIRELVVPERLPTVAAALSNEGINVRSTYLEEVSFVVELTREVERELLKARLRPNGTA